MSTRTRYATLQYQNILTQQLVASTRLAFNRTNLLSNDAPTIPVPAKLEIFEPDYLPNLTFPGATTCFHPTSTEQFVRIQNDYQNPAELPIYSWGPHHRNSESIYSKFNITSIEAPGRTWEI